MKRFNFPDDKFQLQQIGPEVFAVLALHIADGPPVPLKFYRSQVTAAAMVNALNDTFRRKDRE